MVKRLAVIAACGVLALATNACTSGDNGGSSRTHEHTRKTTRTDTAAERRQAARLVLLAGHSSARSPITAPPPAQYSFNVTVAAPVSANVRVNALTWYGETFSILISTHEQGVCRRLGSHNTCFERFPLLPAQRGGKWTVIASKRSGPKAKVLVTFTFSKASP